MIKKIISLALAAFIWWFVYVNLNDPDPVLWSLLYGAAAMIHTMAIFDRYSRLITTLLAFGLLAYAATYFPHVVNWLRAETQSDILGKMVESKPYIEGTREFGGLAIASFTLFVQRWMRKK